jgi:leucyl-tRNA synthetase
MMPHLVVEVWGVDQMRVKVAFDTVVSMDKNWAELQIKPNLQTTNFRH